jgi:hypothetical protein
MKTVVCVLALLFLLFLQAEDLDPSIRDGQSRLKIMKKHKL